MNSPAAAVGQAGAAITSSVQTPWTGTPSALPSTRAVTRPARRPVYGPGPGPDRDRRSGRPGRRPPSASTAAIDGGQQLAVPAGVHRGLLGQHAPCRRAARRSPPGSRCRRRVAARLTSVGHAAAGRRPAQSRSGSAAARRAPRAPRRARRPAAAATDTGPKPPRCARLLTLQGDGDQHVAVTHHQRDLVRGVAAGVEDLQRAERALAEARHPGDGRPWALRGLGRAGAASAARWL